MADRLSIIVPVYNEEENIREFHEELSGVLRKHKLQAEVVYVNDGSQDQSAALLDEIARKDKRAKIVHFRRNFGQTAAISAGFEYAKGDIIIPMDADLQNDPADIPAILEKVREGYQVVSGWRKHRQDRMLSRKLPSWIANYIISRISGVHLHDYGCTMKGYRKEVVKDIRLYGEMHRFIPVYARWEGARITEIVVNHRARTRGVSKYGIGRTFKVILDLLVIKFLEFYYDRPIYPLGGFGIVCLGFSFLSFAGMLYFKLIMSVDFIQTPLPAVATTFFLVGVLSFMLGLVAEMLTRTYYESQHKKPYQTQRKVNLK